MKSKILSGKLVKIRESSESRMPIQCGERGSVDWKTLNHQNFAPQRARASSSHVVVEPVSLSGHERRNVSESSPRHALTSETRSYFTTVCEIKVSVVP